MKNIGVFICNYNGKEYVVNCIRTLLKQTYQDFDIFLVDNASTDQTVDEVKTNFGDKVNIIQNTDNLGGAGGFDRGLKYGLEKEYHYIVLLDNDITLAPDVIDNLHKYLQDNPSVGIVGAKVMIMDAPDVIQDFGNFLDFNSYRERPGYCHVKDDDTIPEVHECDYVPSCAIMIRSELLRKTGTMPAENFIYYDDIELSHKMRLNGYKVVAYGAAKVWHKGGFRKAVVNTFPRYYFLRNRLHFFAGYIPENDIERFADTIVTEVFRQLYGFCNKGMKEDFETTMYAFDDFIHNVRGKADSYKIKDIIKRDTPFVNVIKKKRSILIKFMNNFDIKSELDIYHIFIYIISNIVKENNDVKIFVSLEDCEYSETDFYDKYNKAIGIGNLNFPSVKVLQAGEYEDCEVILKMCQHVNLVDKKVFPEIYVDKYCNCIANEDDFKYFTAYESSFKLFKAIYMPLVIHGINNIRE